MPRGRPPKIPRPSKDIEEKNKPPKELRRITCIGCGTKEQGKFYKTKDPYKKYFGMIPYCKNCVKKIFDKYMLKFDKDQNKAFYYTLRKIDVAYIHTAYLGALQTIQNPTSTQYGEDNLIGAYMKQLGFADVNGWGCTFDESMGENQIKSLEAYDDIIKVRRTINRSAEVDEDFEIIEMDADELVRKWGRFEDEDLAYLEQEYMDWEEQLNGINDKYVDIMVKQICLSSNEIRHARENGLPVDKMLSSLRGLIKDSGISDLQNNEASKQGVGMSARDIEFHRPVREPDPELQDVDNVKDIIIAMLGGTSRALGKENEFTEEFDEVYQKYSIDIIDNLKEKYGLVTSQGGEDDAGKPETDNSNSQKKES